MGFWKFVCTCAGCAAGLACIALTGGAATPLVTAVAIGAGGVAGHLAGHKIEQEEKKVKNQEQITANQTKVIEGLAKDNEKLAKEKNGTAEEIKQKERNAKQKEQEIKTIETKLKDPNVSEEEKLNLRKKLALFKTQLSEEEKELKDLRDKYREIEEQIKSNNKNITSIGSSSSKKGKDIWEFITLENILIAFAIYALWQIVRDSNRKY